MDWMTATEAEKDEANAIAWDAAKDRVRQALRRHPEMMVLEAQLAASKAIALDAAEFARIIKVGERARATKAQRRWVDWARQCVDRLALESGFIFDVDPTPHALSLPADPLAGEA